MPPDPSVKNKDASKTAPVDMRLKLEIQELLAEVNDYVWLYHGRPQWVLRKLQFCPNSLLQEDLEQTKNLLDKAPNVEELIRCRKMMGALPSSDENKERMEFLDRGISNIKKVKDILAELVARVAAKLPQKAPAPALDQPGSTNKGKGSNSAIIQGKTSRTPSKVADAADKPKAEPEPTDKASGEAKKPDTKQEEPPKSNVK